MPGTEGRLEYPMNGWMAGVCQKWKDERRIPGNGRIEGVRQEAKGGLEYASRRKDVWSMSGMEGWLEYIKKWKYD